ncbi:hypothetical protein [Campylobacter insulaenigrae]|uniref:hypothetical protein n=1 Tax=Campylobacter insulaenigrae TaxID=260714 RepID=UPI002432F948|nr:hypothetical protein [Campylobacter insulaenigrae]
MQINDNLSVKEYGYSQSVYKDFQKNNEDFMSLLNQNIDENLNEQGAKFDEFFSKATNHDKFGHGIYSSNMSNIYNYRFRNQHNETPIQTHSTNESDSKDMVKDLLNSL